MPHTSTPVLVGGSIAIDNIKTPTAEGKNLLGGSASFTGIAASYFTSPVHLVGIIGKDFPQEHLDHFTSKGISTDGLERSEGKTFSWTGSYHENMNDRDTLAVDVNVLEDWTPKIPSGMASAPIVVLANMHPVNQLQFIEQLTAEKPFIAADTMDLWITIANDDLEKVLTKIDLLVINESEARDFCKTSNLITAGQRLLDKGLKNVVIKLGEFGAILFSTDQENPDFSPPRHELQPLPLRRLPPHRSGRPHGRRRFLPWRSRRPPRLHRKNRLLLRRNPPGRRLWFRRRLFHLRGLLHKPPCRDHPR